MRTLARFGTDLYVGGSFLGVGCALGLGGTWSQPTVAGTANIARWDGTSWSSVGGGVNGAVHAFEVFQNRLHLGGAFTAVNATQQPSSCPPTPATPCANRIAAWDGTSWSVLGYGLTDPLAFYPYAIVEALDTYNGELYAAGTFSWAGLQSARNIARWNGTSWTSVGAGLLGGPVTGLEVYDPGSGPRLYAVGSFGGSGATYAPGFASWNGTTWSGGGLGGEILSPCCPSALAVWDDGRGAALYLGSGVSTPSGQVTQSLSRWDGAAWEPLGNGVFHDSSSCGGGTGTGTPTGGGPWWVPGAVRAMTSLGPGPSGSLFVAGWFSHAGGTATGPFPVGVQATNIARWSGGACTAITISQSAAGAPLTIMNRNLSPGTVYQNVFSLTLNSAPGSGPYGGLWFGDPAEFIWQLGAGPPFSFTATSATHTWTPGFVLPPWTELQAICVPATGPVSAVTHYVVR